MKRLFGPRTGKAAGLTPEVPLSAKHIYGLAAMFIGAVLLLPSTAGATTVLPPTTTISDPVTTTQKARVDANGNLLVASGYQPVQIQKFISTDVSDTTEDIYSVPAGKRLVIQHIEGVVNYPDSDPRPELFVRTFVGGDREEWIIDTPTPGAAGGGFLNFHGSAQMTLYADGGTTVQMIIGSTGVTGITSCTIVLSGVLVDATAGVPTS